MLPPFPAGAAAKATASPGPTNRRAARVKAVAAAVGGEAALLLVLTATASAALTARALIHKRRTDQSRGSTVPHLHPKLGAPSACASPLLAAPPRRVAAGGRAIQDSAARRAQPVSTTHRGAGLGPTDRPRAVRAGQVGAAARARLLLAFSRSLTVVPKAAAAVTTV